MTPEEPNTEADIYHEIWSRLVDTAHPMSFSRDRDKMRLYDGLKLLASEIARLRVEVNNLKNQQKE